MRIKQVNTCKILKMGDDNSFKMVTVAKSAMELRRDGVRFET